MRLRNKLLVVFVCAFASSALAVYNVQTVPEMVQAANNLLVTLTPDQAAKAKFTFDDRERMNFHFTPGPWQGVARKGLPLREMRPEQGKLAQALLATALSQRGYIKAATIMSLEQILHELERAGGNRIVRDPDGYFVSIFGEPSTTGLWGFRVEGHHLTVNLTIDRGQVVGDTPMFMGANPAEVKEGPRKGLRVLSVEEDLARSLVQSMDSQQKAVAVINPKAPGDIISGENLTFDIGAPQGVPGSRLNAKQRETLMSLIEEYAYRMTPELAAATMKDVETPNLDKVFFAWAGGMNRGDLHYYRVHGPSFLIEYDNTQNGGNHIHSVWRDLKNDFGVDLLREHYRTAHR